MAVYGNMVITAQGNTLYGKVQTGTTLTFTRMQIGGGELATQLSSALTSGTAYTALSVQALTSPVASGGTITIGSGGTTQTVTTNAAAAIGATSISVNSFTANANYAVGATVTTVSDPTTLTALLNPIAYVNINSISTTSGTANIRGIFENTSLAASTYTCEIGLFAQDPTAGEILYAYANAGTQGDTIPPYADGPYSRQFQINTAIGNATTVTANVPAGTYLPVSGGTMTGPLTLAADPTANLQAATKQYVDAHTPPAATTTTLGTVEISTAPGGGNPIAVTTTDPTYMHTARTDQANTFTGNQILQSSDPSLGLYDTSAGGQSWRIIANGSSGMQIQRYNGASWVTEITLDNGSGVMQVAGSNVLTTSTGVTSVNGSTGAVTVQGYNPLTNPSAWIG